MCAAASGGIGSEPILVWLTREAPDVLLCAVVTATAALWWPDDSVGIAAKFCRSVSAASCLCMFTDLQIASATPAGPPQSAPLPSEGLSLAVVLFRGVSTSQCQNLCAS